MKGFTLLEMIAVVIILAMLILIAIPIVTNTVNAAKEKAYDNQIDTIKLAAKAWGAEHLSFMPASNESITIYLWALKNANFIKDSFVNQLTDEEFNNDLAITIENTDMGYKYTVIENSGTEDLVYTNTMPTIIIRTKLKEYVEINTPYIEKGLIVIDTEGNMVSSYTTKYYDGGVEAATIDTSNENIYMVKYVVTFGESTYNLQSEIEIKDTQKPVLNIPSDKTIDISAVSGYDLTIGVSATDNSLQSVTINRTGNLLAIIGTYKITYNATDIYGNKESKSRVISVVDLYSDVTVPTVVFGTNGNVAPLQSLITQVIISDSGSGVDPTSLKYYVSDSTIQPNLNLFTKDFTNNSTIDVQPTLSGLYYLWIVASDYNGNVLITRTNSFKIDITSPLLGSLTISAINVGTCVLTLSITGDGNDINGLKPEYSYYVVYVSPEPLPPYQQEIRFLKCYTTSRTCLVTTIHDEYEVKYQACLTDLAGNIACTTYQHVITQRGRC